MLPAKREPKVAGPRIKSEVTIWVGWQYANSYADGLVAMQREKLREYAQRTDLSDKAREYAVWDLMRFTSEVMKGNVPLG